jgi:uncharacterized protein
MEHSVSYYFDRCLRKVKSVTLEMLAGEDVKILLFGSAARRDFHRHSDIDIAILPKNNYNKTKLILLKEKYENLNIPYSIELIDLSKVSKAFYEKVLDEGEVWKK